jgi:hypothetical protein
VDWRRRQDEIDPGPGRLVVAPGGGAGGGSALASKGFRAIEARERDTVIPEECITEKVAYATLAGSPRSLSRDVRRR